MSKDHTDNKDKNSGKTDFSRGSKSRLKEAWFDLHDLQRMLLSLIPIFLVFFPFVINPFLMNYYYFISPLYGVGAGLVATLLLIRVIGIKNAIGVSIIIIFISPIFIPNINPAFGKAQETEVKSHCHTIMVALGEFADENDGLYPDDIDTLIAYGYLSEFPTNPFSRNEMKSVNLGSEEYEGNFLYVPVHEGDIVIGYYIVGYGFKRNEGMDINGDGVDDQVIIVLDSQGQKIEPGSFEYILPPLEELLAH